jgi:hypothetical protein
MQRQERKNTVPRQRYPEGTVTTAYLGASPKLVSLQQVGIGGDQELGSPELLLGPTPHGDLGHVTGPSLFFISLNPWEAPASSSQCGNLKEGYTAKCLTGSGLSSSR